eukprot:6911701-Heterocapsa_arctica.AAC.1
MPPAVAFRTEKTTDKKIIIDLNNASHKLSSFLHHHSNRIQPFNNGGWFLCSEIFDLKVEQRTSLFPCQRN